jgi:hypothetical protein
MFQVLVLAMNLELDLFLELEQQEQVVLTVTIHGFVVAMSRKLVYELHSTVLLDCFPK